jgi:hypothetical protein
MGRVAAGKPGMKSLFFVFSLLGFGASIMWSVYVQGMACAFSGPSNNSCPPYRWPWQFGNADDALFIGAPQVVFAALLVYSIIILRR